MIKNKISLPINHMCENKLSPDKETPSCVYMEASYMLEAVMMVPFFVGVMIMILFFFPVLIVQQEVGNTLLVTGRKLAVSASDNLEFEAKKIFLKTIKSQEKAEAYIKGGRHGISLKRSVFEGDDICLYADYEIPYPMQLFGVQSLKVTQKIKCRKWKGREYGEEGEKGRIVYITSYGSVYHETRNCTYLKSSVIGVRKAEVNSRRNQSGEIYRACISCVKDQKQQTGIVYITKHGNRYHKNRNCKKIKRNALAVYFSEMENRVACSKCKGK